MKISYIIFLVKYSIKKFSVLTIILLGYAFFLSRYFDFATVWDAQSNVGLVIEAAKKPFNFFNLEQSSHPNQAYFLPQSLLQRLDPGNMVLIHSVDIALGIFMICAFFGILRYICPDNKNRIEIYLMTILFAFYPVFTANSLYAMYDFALTSFMVLTLYFLLKKRYFLAALFGLGQLFSKEPGIVIYGVTIALYYLFFVDNKRHIGTYRKRIKKIFLLFSPFLILLIYVLVKAIVYKSIVFFSAQMPVFMRATSYTSLWPTWDISKVRLSYLVTIFVINFNWILTLVAIFGLVRLLWLHIKKKDNNIKIDKKETLFFFVLFAPVTVVLTYVKIFTNPRYFMPIYFLLLVLFFIATQLIPWVIIRRVLLAAVAALFFLANFETIDPVSKKLFGTFRFGNHDMLKMTSITGECCGYGRDQLVYNLQYIYIDRLTNEIFQYFHADEDTVFAYDKIVGNIFSLGVDRTTRRRNWRWERSFVPREISWTFFDPAQPRPETVYFIDYPFVGPTDTLTQFLTYYKMIEKKVFESDGYKLYVYTLKR